MRKFLETRSVISFIAVFCFASPAFFWPTFSSRFMAIVIGLSLVAAVVSINAGNDFKANLPAALIWTFGILMAAARTLSTTVFENFNEALGILILVYAIFVTLHFIHPKLTAQIYEEQVRPTTRLGKGCLSMSLYVLPVVGVIGAQIGRSLSRLPIDPLTVFGSCVFLLALLFTHPVIARYVQEREKSLNRQQK